MLSVGLIAEKYHFICMNRILRMVLYENMLALQRSQFWRTLLARQPLP